MVPIQPPDPFRWCTRSGRLPMAAGKQGRMVKFDPCCGTRASRASGTCSCFYLRLWKNNNIDIPIPMQNADTYLPLRLSILCSWTMQCYSIFSWFTCTYMCNLSKTPWDSTCVTLHQGRLHRNVSLLVQSHWKSLTSLTCPHAGKHSTIRILVSFALFVLHIRTGPLGELAAWQNEAWTEPWRTFQAINR